MVSLERTGWVATIAGFFLLALSSLGSGSPLSQYQPLILLTCVILVIGSGAYSLVEHYLIMPRIMIQPNHEEGSAVTQYKFVIMGKSKRFSHLEVQASYGWTPHFTILQRIQRAMNRAPENFDHSAWLPLDLRSFAVEEVSQGKAGAPITHIAIERHDLKMFTFATFYAEERRVRFVVTEEPMPRAHFSNAVLVTPYPEIIAKFIGLPKGIVKRYVAIFNPRPWAPDRPAVDLEDAKTRKAKRLMSEREKTIGRCVKKTVYTGFRQVGDCVIAEVPSDELLDKVRKSGAGIP